MRSQNSNPVWSFALGMALGSVLLVVLWGTTRVSAWTGDQILKRWAEATALTWSRNAVTTAADLDRLMSGDTAPAAGATPAAERRSVDLADRVSGIVRYRIVDPSSEIEPGGQAEVETAVALARQAMQTGQPVVRIESGPASIGEPRVARAYVPLTVNGTERAAAEVEIDQTESWQLVHTTLWLSGLAVTSLAAFGFGVPLLAFVRQTRHKEAADERARYLADHDPMTGLLNRSRFVELLDAAIAACTATERIALLWIDLHGLREVNELLGHDSGDTVLVRIAQALRQLAGERALVARFGGDKFAISLRMMSSVIDVKDFASSLLDSIATPQRLGGKDIAILAKIGIALMPGDGDGALRLMKAAGLALERARLRPGSCFVFFERTIETELQRRRELEQQIRDTLAADAFELHFQPLFETASERLTGFEALLRMPDGAGGFVSPAIFIPIAEEIGLITEIGHWVLKRACALAVNWPDHLTVAVNLSPAQFKAGSVHRSVQEALLEAGLPAHRLELEITEGLILNDNAAIMRELADLKALGVSIVMDDFGTGYSSLSYLWKFPFDKIKIDRSFMLALGSEDRQVVDILHAIMSLSRALRMRVTAEGVETEIQASFLKSLGCDEVQGFHFGRPMPIDQVALVIVKDVQRLELPAPAQDNAARRLAAG